jgi:hypothetical protein
LITNYLLNKVSINWMNREADPKLNTLSIIVCCQLIKNVFIFTLNQNIFEENQVTKLKTFSSHFPHSLLDWIQAN